MENNLPQAGGDQEEKNSLLARFKKAVSDQGKKRLIVASALLLVLVLGGGLILLKYRGGLGTSSLDHDFFSNFSKMAVVPQVKGDFKMKAENSDSLGTVADSAYILEGKNPIDIEGLKDHLTVQPEVDFLVEKIGDNSVKIQPQQPFSPNSLVKFKLAGLAEDGQDYAWSYQVKDAFRVLGSIPREQATNVPVNSGIEITFSHDNFENWENYFEISPSAAGSFEKHGRTLVFVPRDPLDFQTLYYVKVKQGLPLSGSSETLDQEYSFAFETERRENVEKSKERVAIFDRELETTADQAPFIEVSVDELAGNLSADVFRFSSWENYLDAVRQRDKIPWWSYSKDQFKIDTAGLSKMGSYELPIKSNDEKNYVELPQPLPLGFYLVELTRGDSKVQIWVQVSDLTTFYNITKTSTIFWVNSGRTKDVAQDVVVELMGTGKKFITDHEGVAQFQTPAEILEYSVNKKHSQDQDGLYFKVSKGESTMIFPASQSNRGNWWSKPDAADSYWRYLYTDRPRYQTNDKISFWGLIKLREGNKINDKVTVTLYKEGYVDYYYQPINIVEQEVALSDFGTFKGEIDVKNLRPDYYALEMKVGDQIVERKYLSIKSYVKPAFDVSLVPEKNLAFAGEDVKLNVKANFFEGTPVPNLNLVLRTSEGERKFTTDQNGEAQLTYGKKYFDCDKTYGCWPSYESLQVVPENSELAEIEASAALRFFGSRTYVNSKVEYPEAGQAEIKMQVNQIDLEKIAEIGNAYGQDLGQQPAGGVKIEGKVIKITYEKKETGTKYDFINKKTYKTYSYSSSEKEVDSFSGNTDQQGRYVLRQSIDPDTAYRVEYKVYDQDGRYDINTDSLYYYNGKFISRYADQNYNYYHLDVVGEEFSLGDEVEALFKKNDELMPEGKNRYLFMQLHNGLQEYKVADNPDYRFVFTADDIPNVALSAAYFNGTAYDLVENGGYGYYGNSGVRYKEQDKKLTIKVQSDKQSYQPGEEVSLDVAVTNQQGKPVETEMNLNLVDEAYYAVADDQASPLSTIYASVGSGVIFSGYSHDNSMLQEQGAEKGGCFAAGTKITMADGSEKPIEHVKKGDKVMTINDPISLELAEGEVTDTWVHKVAEYLVINEELKVTPEHQIFSNGRFTDAGQLKKGDWLLDMKGNRVVVGSIRYEHEIIPVYNLRIDPQHTFFAGGFYVHNEEKGGGPREFFTDAALFEIARTNSDGKANVKFKLPDNITSWRVTSQAISRDLEAGVDTTKLPVSLPVFADVTVGQEYLVKDKPTARMRAYGTALNENDQVDFYVQAPTLGMERSENLTAKAFAPVFYQLPDLKLGIHDVTYNLESSKGSDAVKLPMSVRSSRLEAQFAQSSKLGLDTKIKPVNDLPMVVVLSDEGRNQLYGDLESLGWTYGDRVDQGYVKQEARNLLEKYYQENFAASTFRPSDYQLASGGISLLPYSSEDLALSARVAATGAYGFDQKSMAQYFFNKLEDKKSTKVEISPALFGLAEVGEPVLVRIYSWLNQADDLSAKDKLYLAQALFDLGDETRSRQIYYEVLAQYGEKKDPQVVVRPSNDLDDVFETTALAAVLAAKMQLPEADGLFDYLTSNQVLYGLHKNSENLFNLEKINFIGCRLGQLKPSPASVAYELNGNKQEVKITDSTHSFQVEPQLADKLKFTSVQGDVGISVRYTQPLDLNSVERDKDITVRREYLVDGKIVDHFDENDMVEVRLYPEFSSNALAGEYQVTDILPSGLAPISKISFLRNENDIDCHYWYPYNEDGQMVKYKINRNWESYYCGGKYIKYFARVKAPGTYVAEPVVIQSFVNPDYINYSDSQTVIISETKK